MESELSLDLPFYDTSTFYGRFRNILNVTDPRTLFTTKKQLEKDQQLLESFRAGTLPKEVTQEELTAAKKRVNAIIHPDTGDFIPMPFRMSGFVPFGTPIVVGMLLPTTSLPTIFFWQGLNQTHNALVNYYNRNATVPLQTSNYVIGYLGAVTSAMAVAGGLMEFINRTKLINPATKSVVQRFIAYPAVATANICNIFLMRKGELKTGIIINDENGNKLGTSTVAAKQAIFDTAITRVLLPIPILIIPPYLMGLIENKTTIFSKFPRMRLPINASIVTAAFGLALPLAISIFPQTGSLPVSKLEESYHQLVDSNGKKIEKVFYNKGL